jgi:antitoxin component YwqK of YwqJK toxin-antitoxin module
VAILLKRTRNNEKMKKITFFIIGILIITAKSFGQNKSENIVYIVDKITILEDPEKGNEVIESEIADMNVIKNKDSLKILGFEKFDGAIFIYTKEYRKRTEDIKQIPSSKQMERKNGTWYYNNEIYNGKFIDYYYSGRIQGDGILKNGKLEGLRKMYYQNGKTSVERNYTNSISNGLEKEYYEDGSIKQKGEFINGQENGIWETYFPNGQVKQKTNLKNGIVEGESIIYYSTGKVLSVEIGQNGKIIPDKRLEKITQLMKKSNESNKNDDRKSAIKYCTKAIELDSEFAEAYFSRGTLKLNEMQFDEAIADFDKALVIEPFMTFAIANRAFARIRKYEFGEDRQLLKNNEITVLASKKKVDISEIEKEKICKDLKQAISLGDKVEMILEAEEKYCK